MGVIDLGVAGTTVTDLGMTGTTGAVDPTTANRSLVRVRIMVLLVGFMAVGGAAGGIFDQFEWVLLIAPVVPTIAAVLLVGRNGALRAIGAMAAIMCSVVIAVVANSGGTSDVLSAFTSGVQGLLSTEWPSPDRADLIGTVVAVIATSTAISDELAARRRFHLLPLVPLLWCYVAAVALSSPRGITWSWLIVLGVVATLFAMLRNDGTLHDRIVLLRGERRIVPLLLIGVVVVALIAVTVSLTARADPRRNDPAQQTAPVLGPIQATLALRALDPPRNLHRVIPADGVALPVRWRTAALSSYDGRRWAPELTLRPIGNTLGPVTGPLVSADIEFLDDNLTLVPLPGAPVSVDAAVETDPERTVVRLAEPPTPGDLVAIVANLAPTPIDLIDQGTAARLVDESTSSLTDLAEGLAGDGSAIDQLTQLETIMREEFVLDNNVQGGGLQQALIDRFLRDTQRGTSEQFATAFVLLARSLGIEARVATGFVVGGDSDGGATSTSDTVPTAGEALILSSADAEIWPEVQLTDGQWLAFDPTPVEESTIEAPEPPEPQTQTPAAPQPPIPPPPEPDNETLTPDEADTAETTSALSTTITWAIRAGVGIGILLLPFAAAAAAITGIKFRRRRRRLHASVPSERIRGAWASATDALVDAGLDISQSATDGEIVGAGEPLVANGSRNLYRLAALSGVATYGSPEHPDLLAEDATRCLDAVEESMASERTRWQQIRWRLSLRSLRPATRSPVTV
ncbi:MAG TPA: transglutaminaseTgpA domain-containing protein [Ilumatobacteraceae bacterium]|nr:transglutaminaseTgpA domain-containing protein [Ilumatobacteraceae bacterium]